MIYIRDIRGKLTNGVDFIRELPGTEGSRVGGDALVEQVDDVAVPASLRRRHGGPQTFATVSEAAGK